MKYLYVLGVMSLLIVTTLTRCDNDDDSPANPPLDKPNLDPTLVAEGKDIFRFDSFGDEAFWTDVLHIDKAILGDANGGFGEGVSPATALTVGLKVDAEALPASLVTSINNGDVDLNDPATTVALLKLDAVVGLKGGFDATGKLISLGVTCAVCHSTVDDSFSPGIGKRLDGWANRDLNVGAIISLSDNLQPVGDLLDVDVATLKTVLAAWGPGKYDAVLFLDGKAQRPDGTIKPDLIPSAYGMQGIELTTYTGWGSLSYWNNMVAVNEMHGMGNFSDPRINDAAKYPVATENGLYNVTVSNDLVTPKLPALREYQLSLDPPVPAAGTYNQASADLGEALFTGKGNCASCHKAPIFADNVLHTPEEMGIDDYEASRSPTGKYRTTPLRGVYARAKGGFYHDGRYATLKDVVDHYNVDFQLDLTSTEIDNLVEYLKSI
jgi:mono/diheme cytochrome c family protein